MKSVALALAIILFSSCTSLPLSEDAKSAFREEFTTTNKRLAGKLWKKGKYKRDLSRLTKDDYLISLRSELLGAEENLKLVLDEGAPEIAIKGVMRDFYVCLKSVKADVYSCDQAIPYGVELQSVELNKSLNEALLDFIQPR